MQSTVKELIERQTDTHTHIGTGQQMLTTLNSNSLFYNYYDI